MTLLRAQGPEVRELESFQRTVNSDQQPHRWRSLFPEWGRGGAAKWSPHRSIEDPQEVDLIITGIHLGLQLCLAHVSGVHILQRRGKDKRKGTGIPIGGRECYVTHKVAPGEVAGDYSFGLFCP